MAGVCKAPKQSIRPALSLTTTTLTCSGGEHLGKQALSVKCCLSIFALI